MPRQLRLTDIAQRRLRNQQLVRPVFDKPGDIVRWFGAVQAQEYEPALWALGVRTRGAPVQADIEHAVARREIVRTWPLRNTLHFVAKDDVHWMLQLLGPRMIAATAPRHRDLELDARVLARSEKIIVAALIGGRQLTRRAIYETLASAGVATAESRGLHILAHLSLRRILCFGPRSGKQPTFVLLDEWLPNAKSFSRDGALAELALRYFTSHGPATIQDFAWWSGLTMSDARAGIETAKPQLVSESIDGRTHFLASTPIASRGTRSARAHLLPQFDEYTVAYRDRTAVLDAKFGRRVNAGGGIFKPIVVFDGAVVATWGSALDKDTVAIYVAPFRRLTKPALARINEAAKRYAHFRGLRHLLSISRA